MAKITKPLSDREIKAAKSRDKDYVLSDGGGLQLRVRAHGSKLWNFNYIHPITKKRVNLGLGAYPDVSLSKARELRQTNRQLVTEGIDPKAYKQETIAKKKAQTEHTLFNVAQQWFEVKSDSITVDHAKDIWRSLELNVFPDLGQLPIRKISAPYVIDVLRPIEAKGSLETLKRVVQRLNEVMIYAVNCGLIDSNPISGLKSVFKKPQKENMKALAPNELPELMRAVANASIKRTTRCLIEWQLHTITRPSEAAGARWEEIDLERKVWTIPAERMKKRREHSIPLTSESIALLEAIHPLSGHREFIFPSDRDPKKPCNSQTANMALKRMGFEGRLVSHGLRSLASTTLNEQGFNSDLIEAALAHVDSNQVRAAYNRTDYLEQRREMMSWWSRNIREAAQGNLSITGAKNLKIK
ncbi:integrase domain-containing protein [Photobacterium sp. DNB23_23_1]